MVISGGPTGSPAFVPRILRKVLWYNELRGGPLIS